MTRSGSRHLHSDGGMELRGYIAATNFRRLELSRLTRATAALVGWGKHIGMEHLVIP